jgi:TetR/AcrR family transcriptional regulator, transcriptional repressor for nem operon
LIFFANRKMKLTKLQVADNRHRIIETAGRLFREHGFEGVGLADLMKAAGFTHGGFYNHFPSKEALAAEAALSGLRRSNSKLLDVLMEEERDRSSGLAKFVERYLSSEHRDDRAGGCTIASLACDAARQGKEIQASFAKGIEDELSTFASCFASGDAEDQGLASSARELAIQLMSELVGAVILARVVAKANPSLSDEILRVSRRNLEWPARRSGSCRRLTRRPAPTRSARSPLPR